MPKLTEYPKAKSFDAGDVFIKDGIKGTHKITVEDAFSEYCDEALTDDKKFAPASVVGDLKTQSNQLTDRINNNPYTTLVTSKDAPNEAFAVLLGYIRGSDVTNPGAIHYYGTASSVRTYWFKAEDDLEIYLMGSGGNYYRMRISDEQPKVGDSVAWTGELYEAGSVTSPLPTQDNPLLVPKGKYIAFGNGTGSATFTFCLRSTTTGDFAYALKGELHLTETMEDDVRRMMNDETFEVIERDVYNAVRLSTDTLSATSHDVSSILPEIPDYYKNAAVTPTTYEEAMPYLENRIAAIPAGRSFIFVTDTHVEGNPSHNAGHSSALIDYVKKRVGISKVLFGGDVSSQANDKYKYKKQIGGYLLGARRLFGANFLPCYGDHDTNLGNSLDATIPKADLYLPYNEGYDVFFGDLKRTYHWMDVVAKFDAFLEDNSISYTQDDYDDVIGFFKSVYYIDDGPAKIRYISLNCGQAAARFGGLYNIFGAETFDVLRIQCDWLKDVLMTTPSGYDIVVLGHKVCNMSSTSGDYICKLLSAFKRKYSSFQPRPAVTNTNIDIWWPNTTKYNFSKAPDVGIILQINGHRHFDRFTFTGLVDSETEEGTKTSVTHSAITSGATIDQTTGYGQIVEITTQTDAYQNTDSQSSAPMALGTITEQCFDVVTLTDDHRIVCTRFGAGDDRWCSVAL